MSFKSFLLFLLLYVGCGNNNNFNDAWLLQLANNYNCRSKTVVWSETMNYNNGWKSDDKKIAIKTEAAILSPADDTFTSNRPTSPVLSVAVSLPLNSTAAQQCGIATPTTSFSSTKGCADDSPVSVPVALQIMQSSVLSSLKPQCQSGVAKKTDTAYSPAQGSCGWSNNVPSGYVPPGVSEASLTALESLLGNYSQS